MSSVCGRLDFKDAESHLESTSASSPNKCSNSSKHISGVGSEDAQESDGDDSGYIHQNLNQESENKSLDDEGEGKSLNDEGEEKSLDDVDGEDKSLDDEEGEDKSLDDDKGEDKSVDDEGEDKSLDDEGEDKNLATALQDMFSENQKSVVTLIPAVRGSREKYGKSLQKLSVSWAEDVYDPPPSIVSHTKSKKQQPPQKSKRRENVKKSGKKGQKGSSKDKKHSSSSRSKHSRDMFDWDTQMPIVA